MSIEIPLPQVHDEGVRIQTVSRIWFPLIEPKVENVRIEDIACGLAHICRFVGQIRAHLSVAEHCCHCADKAAPHLKACGTTP